MERACYWTDRKEWLVEEQIVSQEQYDGGPFDFGASYQEGTLKAVIDSLLSIRDEIPKEFWGTARCGIDSVSGYEGSHHARIEVSYLRPATEEEINAVKERDRRQAENAKAIERAMYEELKRKFG